MASDGVFFAVAVYPLTILIAFVGGDYDHDTVAVGLPHGLEQIDSPHHVGGIGLHRLGVGCPDNRLGRQVENARRLRLLHRHRQRSLVPHISRHVTQAAFEAQLHEERRRGRRRKTVPDDLRAEHEQPFGQPRALEARMAGHQHPLAAVPIAECLIHGQIFQGACPLSQSLLSRVNSWRVSIGCQNPWCW